MTALNTYRRWLARVEDDALRAELSALDEVRDARADRGPAFTVTLPSAPADCAACSARARTA